MLERNFQSDLIKELKLIFPGCVVLKNDSLYRQGIPDLSIFYRDKWAWLEVKRSEDEPRQPNQEYYIDLANEIGSFGRFIFPENKEEVLNDLREKFSV